MHDVKSRHNLIMQMCERPGIHTKKITLKVTTVFTLFIITWLGLGVRTGGLGVPPLLQEEVDRSTPLTRLIRDVPGGSALSS